MKNTRDELKQRVPQQTADRAKANAALKEQIAERRRAEEALRESEQRFRRIFNHANDAIFVVDQERDRIEDVNPRACQMLGYTREELLATPVSAIHPDEMPALIESYRERRRPNLLNQATSACS